MFSRLMRKLRRERIAIDYRAPLMIERVDRLDHPAAVMDRRTEHRALAPARACA
jgi:hypothetical protein